jgi:hypothetical protein
MLFEWLEIIVEFYKESHEIINRDVNNHETRWKTIVSYAFFVIIPGVILYFNSNAVSLDFIDYIKDIFAILIGFFSTVLVFIYEKLEIKKIPSETDENKKPIGQRLNSEQRMLIIQTNQYIKRFLYGIGLNIINSGLVLILLLLSFFFDVLITMNLDLCCCVNNLCIHFSCENLRLFFIQLFVLGYRFIILYLVLRVFSYMLYSVSSLLKVLIKK